MGGLWIGARGSGFGIGGWALGVDAFGRASLSESRSPASWRPAAAGWCTIHASGGVHETRGNGIGGAVHGRDAVGRAGSAGGEGARGAAPQATADAAKQAKVEKAAAEKRQKEAAAWVAATMKKMTLDEKIGQLLFPSINAAYLSTDTEEYEKLLHLVRDLKVGGFHVFGSGEAMPAGPAEPRLGSSGSAARKGEPYAAAVLLNRLQSESAIPLLTSGDFEGGAAYILNGATRLPRAMAIAATRDTQLAYQAGVVGATEARAVGVNVDFYPVVDVNNNPRNPIINIRSFGEDPALVSEMALAYIKGIQSTGAFATVKHFPGHGDTAVDTHLGLAIINHPRERLDKVELVPFKAAIDAGVDAVMSTHIILPALDPTPGIPATLSRPILTGLLRDELKFKGLIFTDSMTMDAISKGWGADKSAAMAVKAGVDFVLHSPDDDAAFKGIKAAVQAGEISEAQLNTSVERILRAKARLGLHANRLVDVAAIATKFGGRAHAKVAQEINDKAFTLIKDEKNAVPIKAGRDANVLYLSVLDYASGWRESVPSRVDDPRAQEPLAEPDGDRGDRSHDARRSTSSSVPSRGAPTSSSPASSSASRPTAGAWI